MDKDGNVKIDSETLEGYANNILKYASELNDVLTNINNEFNNIRENWSGVSSEDFFNEYGSFWDSHRNAYEKMEEVANAIVAINNGYALADTESSDITETDNVLTTM